MGGAKCVGFRGNLPSQQLAARGQRLPGETGATLPPSPFRMIHCRKRFAPQLPSRGQLRAARLKTGTCWADVGVCRRGEGARSMRGGGGRRSWMLSSSLGKKKQLCLSRRFKRQDQGQLLSSGALARSLSLVGAAKSCSVPGCECAVSRECGPVGKSPFRELGEVHSVPGLGKEKEAESSSWGARGVMK